MTMLGAHRLGIVELPTQTAMCPRCGVLRQAKTKADIAKRKVCADCKFSMSREERRLW